MTDVADSRLLDHVDRRTVLLGAGAAGAVGVLAACGGSETPQVTPSQSVAATDVPTRAAVIARTADVPVGGGLVVEDKMVVVTQSTEGQFRAFTSTCPHQGCSVNEVTEQEIICPCHGSKFSTATGEVLQGPASVGLAQVTISVEGDEIVSQA
jgi:Rieske Fe-S protein